LERAAAERPTDRIGVGITSLGLTKAAEVGFDKDQQVISEFTEGSI
jgi:hypothetical protein